MGDVMMPGPDVPPFVDTPLEKAVRRAFDNPTVDNLHRLSRAAHTEGYRHGYRIAKQDALAAVEHMDDGDAPETEEPGPDAH